MGGDRAEDRGDSMLGVLVVFLVLSLSVTAGALLGWGIRDAD